MGFQESVVVSAVDVDITKSIEMNHEALDALIGEFARICVDAIMMNKNTDSVLL